LLLDGTSNRNLHAHIFLPTRSITETGVGPKIRSLDLMWESRKEVEDLRAAWARLLSVGLAFQGEDIDFDHRSYLRRGIKREPQAKEGKGRAMSDRGIFSERVDLNEKIASKNEIL